MAFRDFTYPQVFEDLNLTLENLALFDDVPPYEPRAGLEEWLQEGYRLAFASGTEKAKSEFLIVPILMSLHLQMKDAFSLFSGTEWNVDTERGLNGYCDFILTKGASPLILTAPYIAIVESKNEILQSGLGQCIAAMFAAQLSNAKAQSPIKTVYGAVTIGTIWKFLKLRDATVTLDTSEYHINNLSKILGILKHIVTSDLTQ